MKIALDMQSRQTAGSRERGIGRYSLSLAQAMLRRGRDHEFSILLNGVFRQTIEKVRADFEVEKDDPRIKIFQTLPNSTDWYPQDAWRHNASEYLRESFIAAQRFDFVHCTSLFESPMDDSSTSWGRVENPASHAITLYDLIPYVFSDLYLTEIPMRISYLRKIQELRKADLLLAISDYSRREAIERLGVDPERIFDIAGAADDRFRPVDVPPDVAEALLASHELGKFIMYTGGIDHRKNIERLIKAYARLPGHLVREYQLVIVCSVQPYQREALQRLAIGEGLAPDRLVMTGYVSDDDLLNFYNLCDLFIFPSWCEGFGLPALEAMQCGVPVIAAGTSSLPEVVGMKDALFDPFSLEDIASKMELALEDDAFRERLVQHGLSQAKKFTWDNSAAIAMAAMEESHERKTAASKVMVPAGDLRPTLAFISPLPPRKSGISGYSAQLLPFLDKYYRITLICQSGEVSDDYLAANFPVNTPDWLKNNADSFDRVIYQFGNSDHHSYMFRMLETVPGTVVLHDFWMSNVLEYIQLYQDDPTIWDEHLHYSHGWPALGRRTGAGHDTTIVNEFPCNLRLITSSVGVIVHSAYSSEMIRDWYGDESLMDVRLINSLKAIAPEIDRADVKAKLGLSTSEYLVCSFGFIHSTKHSLRLARAFMQSALYLNSDARLVLVGQNADGAYGVEISQIVSETGGRVSFTGFVSDADYALYLAAADAAVQLRGVSRGETSAAALDCLANRVALVINDNGAFSQIPDDAAVRIQAEFDDAELVGVLDTILADQDRLARLRAAGEAYLRSACDPRLVAACYRDAIEQFYRTSPVALRDNLAERVAEIDAAISPIVRDLEMTSSSVIANFPGRSTVRHCFVDETLVPELDEQSLRQWLVANDDAIRTELFRINEFDYVNAIDTAAKLLGVESLRLTAAGFDLARNDICLLGPDVWASSSVATAIAGRDRLLHDARISGARVWLCWPLLDAHAADQGFEAVSLELERMLPFVEGVIVGSKAGAELVIDHLALMCGASDSRVPAVLYQEQPGIFPDPIRLFAEHGHKDGWESVEANFAVLHAWQAENKALLTESGVLQNGFYRTQGRAGFLVYGPYAALKPGQYTLRIVGTATRGAKGGVARYELVADKGETVLGGGVLDANSGRLAESTFLINKAVKGLEIRIWADAEAELAFRGYYLYQHHPSQSK